MQFRARRNLSPSCKVHQLSNLHSLSSLHGSLAIKPMFTLLSQSSSTIKLRFTLLVAWLTGNQTNVYTLVVRFKSHQNHFYVPVAEFKYIPKSSLLAVVISTSNKKAKITINQEVEHIKTQMFSFEFQVD